MVNSALAWSQLLHVYSGWAVRAFLRGGKVRAGLLLISCLLLSSAHPVHTRGAAGGQNTPEASAAINPQGDKAEQLGPGRRVQKKITGDEKHLYVITLSAGQFLKVIADQQGADVVLKLYGPDNPALLEVDSPNGDKGPEELLWIAERPGDYTLEVRSLGNVNPAGLYDLRIEELRNASPEDRGRISTQLAHLAALAALSEGAQLQEQGTPEALKNAVAKFEGALAQLRTHPAPALEAEALTRAGMIYSALGDKRRALKLLDSALPLWRAAKIPTRESDTLNQIGLVFNSLGMHDRATHFFSEAVSLAKTRNDQVSEGVYLSNLGASLSAAGDNRKAIETLKAALLLKQNASDAEGTATALGLLSEAHNALGEKREALDYSLKSLSIREHLASPIDLAKTLSSVGGIYSDLGEGQKGLDFLNRALAIARQFDDADGQVSLLSNIGSTYSEFGEKRRAVEFYARAVELFPRVTNPAIKAVTLHSRGTVYSYLGESESALADLNQALVFWKAAAIPRGEASTLSMIGQVYFGLNDNGAAMSYFDAALQTHRRARDLSGEAYALGRLGFAYLRSNRPGEALESFRSAHALHGRTGDPRGVIDALYGLALVNYNLGNLMPAKSQIEEVLEEVEKMRSNVISSGLRASFLSTKQEYYKFYIGLLMRLHKQRPSAGFDAAALQASERARARSLLELLSEARADIRQGVDSALLEEERSLREQLNAKAAARVRLLGGSHTAGQATAASKEIEGLTTRYEEAQARIRQSSPRYAALTQPRPLGLKELQRQLDPDTLLLEYSLGEKRSYLWLVSPTEIKSFELPARGEVEAAVRLFYELLTSPNSVYMGADRKPPLAPTPLDAQQREVSKTTTRLSRMLLGPVASQLGRKRLVVIADGALQYVPFAALPDPTSLNKGGVGVRPLIEQHEIVSLPSISVLATSRSELAGRNPAPQELAVLADPVFYPDDERVTGNPTLKKPVQRDDPSVVSVIEKVESVAKETRARRDGNRLARLAGTRNEARGIMALVPAGRAKAVFDFDASRALAVGGELSQYRYVHFATHGLVDSLHPELSAIVLSLVDENGNPRDGYLRAHEIFNLKLPADVVTLSGCQTGLGKEVRGEGLIGLTRGLMYAGAARVVVSLWSVDDEATATLMRSFYRGMIKEGRRPAEALRAAQIEMMRQPRWRAPHYWAAFVLQGEWK
jgi:CHAT domain-containing protein/tetratricopeptide (TPR) repeat protein